MKEKKTVLSVILGVSLVTLIIALVAGFTDSLSLLIDGENVDGVYYSEGYNYLVGGLEFGLIALGISFAAVFCRAKNKRNKVGIILASVLAGYFLITAIVLRALLSPWSIRATDYTLFMSYISSAITITVSAALACISFLLLTKTKEAEEIKQTEQEVSEEQ